MIEQGHKLGEVLRAAREAKGTDLTRVERETKIRERYLSALERGEYRELPGAVYTKGFLRNYGAYLGLDPEYLIDLYRLETSTTGPDRPVLQAPPRPIAVRRRRTFVVTPGAVVAAILTLLVGAFVAWLGYEFVNFARTPELRITEPAGDVADHSGTTITVRGITAANARITVRGLSENPSVTADAQGNFEVTVGLVPGSNVIRLIARDPVTNRDSEEVARTVVVADGGESATPGVALALSEPVADAVLGGPVPVAGMTAPGAQIQVTAVLVTAPTVSFAVTDANGAAVAIQPAAPTAPPPTILTADAAGAFGGSLALPAGIWEVSVAVAPGEPATRRVTVGPAAGLTGMLLLEGGPSYLEVDQDGVALAVGGDDAIVQAGDSVPLTATSALRIKAGNAGAVRLTIDGIFIGAMGAPDAVVEWQITRSGA